MYHIFYISCDELCNVLITYVENMPLTNGNGFVFVMHKGLFSTE